MASTSLRVLSHQTLYSDERFHAAFPSIVRLPDDSLRLAFRRGRDPRYFLGQEGGLWASHLDPRSHLATLRLSGSDLGVMEPIAVIPPDPEAAEQDASLHVLSDGRLALASFAYYPFLSAGSPLFVPGQASGAATHAQARAHLITYISWGGFLRFSDDGGTTFGPHLYFPAVPGDENPWYPRRSVFPCGVRGALAEQAGELFVAAYGGHGGPAGAHLFATTDGTDLRHRTCMARDEEKQVHVQEPALLALEGGEFAVYCRSAGLDDRMITARSREGGQCFDAYVVHEARGHPVHPLRLSDGKVLLTYGYRHEPYGIRARLLDEPTAIDDAAEFVVRDDGKGTDLGYPWAVEVADGRILVVYYWETPSGSRVIESTWLARD